MVENLDLENRYETFFKAQPPSFNPIRDIKRWVSGLIRSVISITSQNKRDAEGEESEQAADSSAGILTKREMIARAVAGGIMIMPVEESSVVALSYRSTNPEFATIVVNAVAKAYIDQILEMKMQTAGHGNRRPRVTERSYGIAQLLGALLVRS